MVSVSVLKALGGWSHVYLRLRAPLLPHAGLKVTINEPDGPFTASGAVTLQTESPRNITVVTAHTYEISCSSSMGVTPVWRHNGSLVANSQPISGTPGVYVREPTNHNRVLALQNVTQCAGDVGLSGEMYSNISACLGMYQHVTVQRLVSKPHVLYDVQ